MLTLLQPSLATDVPVDLPRQPGPRGALVFGGSHGALAVVRDLGRAGIANAFLAHDHPIVRFSRYLDRTFEWPGATAPGAIEFLIDLAAEEDLEDWLLIPCGDAEARLIAENQVDLSRVYSVCGLPWDRLRLLYDKKCLYEIADALGIAYPRLITPEQLADPRRDDIVYPVIIKPAVRDRDNALTRDKAWKAEFPDQLVSGYRRAVELMGRDQVIVQEMIPGDGRAQFSYAGVWHQGTPVATLVARRTRQFPREFGFTSTFVETIDNPAVEEAATRLLAALDYSGLVEIEFKHDWRDGRYKVLDVNCRAWTWLGLGAASGLDLGTILFRLSSGEDVPRCRGRTGIAWMHMSRDLLAAAGGPDPALLRPSAYLRALPRIGAFAAWANDDPLPGVMDLPLLAPRLVRRLWNSFHGDGPIATLPQGT